MCLPGQIVRVREHCLYTSFLSRYGAEQRILDAVTRAEVMNNADVLRLSGWHISAD